MAENITQAPEFINWSYTYDCNFSCGHCYSRAPNFPGELSESEYSLIVDRLIEANIFRIGFGGGEPFFRKDFLENLSRLSKAGIYTYFTTNGSYINETVADTIKEASVGMVSVSVDAASHLLHDKIRNRQGSLKLAINAIKLLVCRGIHTVLTFTVHKQNMHEMEAVVDLAAKLNASEVNIKLFRSAGNGKVLEDVFALSSSEKTNVLEKIGHLKQQDRIKVSTFGNLAGAICSCGNTTLTLRPNGDLVVCPYTNKLAGNLTELSLSDIWLNSPVLIERRMKEKEKCLADKIEVPWPVSTDINPAKELKHSDTVKRKWSLYSSV